MPPSSGSGPPDPTMQWLERGEALVPAIAWGVVILWVIAFGLTLALRKKKVDFAAEKYDLLAFSGVFALALALRLALPWGPMSFAEADRLACAWRRVPSIQETFESVPALLGLLRYVGFEPAALMRYPGPIFGALGVGFTFLLGRAAGLSRPASLVGAAALLVWPAHVRYSASGALTVSAMAIWTGAFALALTQRISLFWKVPLLTACVVLGVYARPECRLLAVAILPLCFAKGWSWKGRGALAAFFLAGLLPYVIAYGKGEEGRGYSSWTSRIFADFLAHDTSVNPLWWFALGLLGLLVGRLIWPLRVTLVATIAALAGAYWFSASENNPLWGQWRYVVALVPFVALGLSALAEHFPRHPKREESLYAIAALTLLSGLLYARLLIRPIDAQAELAYVRETAPRIASEHDTLVLLTDEDQRQIRFEAVPIMGLAAALGPLDWPRGSGGRSAPGKKNIRTVSGLLSLSPEEVSRAAVFLGMYRDPKVLAKIEGRFTLVPIDEREVLAAPMLQYIDTQCALPRDAYQGASLEDCALRLGWYELSPIAP